MSDRFVAQCAFFPLLLAAIVGGGLSTDIPLIEDYPLPPIHDVSNKLGCVCEQEEITCAHTGPSTLSRAIFEACPGAKAITFDDCNEEECDIGLLANASHVERISLRRCRIRNIAASEALYGLQHLHLSDNYLSEWGSICELIGNTPALTSLDLSFNYLPSLHSLACLPASLRLLNLSHNQVSIFDMPSHIEVLDLSSNELMNVSSRWPLSLKWVNLSSNPLLREIPPLSLPNLKYLNLDGCQLSEVKIVGCPRLRSLSLRDTAIEVIDLDAFNAPLLRELDLLESSQLSSVIGILPSHMRSFRISNSLVSYLPQGFFSRAKKLHEVLLTPNAWNCNECLIGWLNELPEESREQLNCSHEYSSPTCTIGVPTITNERKIVRARYGESAVLQCEAFGNPPPSIEWWLVRPEKFIGSYEPIRKQIQMNWSRNDSYRIILGGNLIIQNSNRCLVERYRCIASNEAGNVSRILHFRLDYSFWYSLELFHSVFWGSVVASLLLCAVSFVLNVLWITCRKTGLWWIRRTERLSRVRNMVEAVEKYRQKQALSLHESYHKGVDHVRENYHQQVEQLRASYAVQVERFRDYRAAQMETMGQHLDNIRDNYNQQMCRLRDYGARRVEQLWESYERQMNRVRTFSLQQRLKLMRQYKVKQHYLNSLLEKFGSDINASDDCLKQHSEAAVLGPVEELEVDGGLSPSSSYYSLPEYLIDEDGHMHYPSSSDPSRMFSRHQQFSSGATRSRQQPSSSRQTRKSKGEIGISPSSLQPVRRRLSLRSSPSSESTNADTSSTSKIEDVTLISQV
uniref:Ig-like domain-containing protein n=1 Tax=Parascaris univalens TaxID=6257 RepID=A0A915C084_PARUN